MLRLVEPCLPVVNAEFVPPTVRHVRDSDILQIRSTVARREAADQSTADRTPRAYGGAERRAYTNRRGTARARPYEAGSGWDDAFLSASSKCARGG